MPKFKKTENVAKVVVFIPEDAEVNNSQQWRMSPPITEYENRRCSVGREAIKKITGK